MRNARCSRRCAVGSRTAPDLIDGVYLGEGRKCGGHMSGGAGCWGASMVMALTPLRWVALECCMMWGANFKWSGAKNDEMECCMMWGANFKWSGAKNDEMKMDEERWSGVLWGESLKCERETMEREIRSYSCFCTNPKESRIPFFGFRHPLKPQQKIPFEK